MDCFWDILQPISGNFPGHFLPLFCAKCGHPRFGQIPGKKCPQKVPRTVQNMPLECPNSIPGRHWAKNAPKSYQGLSPKCRWNNTKNARHKLLSHKKKETAVKSCPLCKKDDLIMEHSLIVAYALEKFRLRQHAGLNDVRGRASRAAAELLHAPVFLSGSRHFHMPCGCAVPAALLEPLV